MFYNKPRVKAFIYIVMLRFLHSRLVCTLCVSLFAYSLLSAQEVDTLSHKQLLELEVVSSSKPSAVSSLSPLQVMDNDDFLRAGVLSLSDAVKRMTGVDVRDYGGVGGLKTVSVRGMGAKHTAVSYDGLVLADVQSGQVDIGRLSLENVGLLSLSMAGADDIFRSATEHASASLLTLHALRPAGDSAYARVRVGSFGLADAAMHYEHCFTDNWSASLHGNYICSNGMYPFLLVNGNNKTEEKRRDSDVRSFNMEGNLFGKVMGGDMAVKISFYDSERGLPGALNMYNKENRERLWDDNFYVQAYYDVPLNRCFRLKARLKYDYHYSNYTEINKNYASGQQIDTNEKNEYYASVGAKCSPLDGLSFALTTDMAYSTLYNNFEDSRMPRRVSSMSVFAVQYSIWRFKATASLLGTFIADEVKSGAQPAPYKRLSPSVALTFQPVASFPLRLRASYKDAYRVPTFADLYYLRLGNVGLKPEKATQCNFGITWNESFGRVVEYASLAVDGYYNRVHDKIVALPTMYVWRMMNCGEAEIAGVDANMQLQLAVAKRMSLLFDAGYSFQHAVDITDPSAKNYRHQLPYTPRHSGKFTLSFINPYVNLSYIFTAVGDRYMLPQNTARNRIDGYAEHSLSANRDFLLGQCALRLQGELLNIGNRQYEIIKYYPMPRFSWRMSARLSF